MLDATALRGSFWRLFCCRHLSTGVSDSAPLPVRCRCLSTAVVVHFRRGWLLLVVVVVVLLLLHTHESSQVLTQQDIDYFGGLMSEVERTELVTDDLYSLDVQFISDDDKYFPFEVPDACLPIYVDTFWAKTGFLPPHLT